MSLIEVIQLSNYFLLSLKLYFLLLGIFWITKFLVINKIDL